MKFKILYSDYGIANRFSNGLIVVNKKLLLPKYHDLLIEIVDHEMKHTDKGYSTKDFLLDIHGFTHRALYWNFIMTTPSAWLQFSPLWHFKSKWYWDWSVFTLWIFLILFCYSLTRWIIMIN